MKGLQVRVAVLRLLSLLAILLIASACSPFSNNQHQSDSVAECLAGISSPSPANGLFVEPDDGHDPVVRELAAARCTIDVSVYLLTDDAVIGALTDADARGVRVRVTLEEHPFGGGGTQDEVKSLLDDAGVAVQWSGSDIRFSHAKYIVVDAQVALIMNLNLTTSAFESNREFGITTTDPEAVSQAQEIFERDWQGEAIDDVPGSLIVSPTNSRERMLAMIEHANRSIDLYAEVIRDSEIVSALGAAEARGVAVRLIVDESLDEDTQAIAAELYGMGVEIRIADTLYIHAKLMTIDAEVIVVGSQNFTATSLDQNRELAIVITDAAIVDRAMVIFDRDWQRAVPGSPRDEGG